MEVVLGAALTGGACVECLQYYVNDALRRQYVSATDSSGRRWRQKRAFWYCDYA